MRPARRDCELSAGGFSPGGPEPAHLNILRTNKRPPELLLRDRTKIRGFARNASAKIFDSVYEPSVEPLRYPLTK